MSFLVKIFFSARSYIAYPRWELKFNSIEEIYKELPPIMSGDVDTIEIHNKEKGTADFIRKETLIQRAEIHRPS